jgi:CO/xanthine dehydrogenase FAD-binding subunit
MPIPDITLHEPRTAADACSLLKQYAGSAKILAGGTDLLVDLKREAVTGIDHLISIKHIAELHTIEELPDAIKIGTMVTPNQAARHPLIKKYFPAFIDAIMVMAATPIRNMATVGGNIASAVPCSDFAPFFITAGAEAVLTSGGAERTVRVDEYFLGPRDTVREDTEVLTHLIVPKPKPRTGGAYKKFMLREINGVAVAGSAAEIVLSAGDPASITRCRIVLTAVAPTPLQVPEADRHLEGKVPSEKLFAEAAAIARKAARPITDIRGTKEYRYELVEVLTRRALEAALARAREER